MGDTKKYILLQDDYKILDDGTKVYRIKAVRDFNNKIRTVYAGELGGYVQSIDNLDRYSPAWVFDDSIVCGDAYVRGKSAIIGESVVCDNAFITNNVLVEDGYICDNALVCGNAQIRNSIVGNDSVVGFFTWLLKSKVWDKSSVFEINFPKRTTITDCVGKYKFLCPQERVAKYLMIPENDGLFRVMALRDIETKVGIVKKGEVGGLISGMHNLSQFGNSWIFNGSVVRNNSTIQDDAIVMGNSIIENNVVACEHAQVKDCKLGGRVVLGGGVGIENMNINGNLRFFGSNKLNGDLYSNSTILYPNKKPLNILTTTDFRSKLQNNTMEK